MMVSKIRSLQNKKLSHIHIEGDNLSCKIFQNLGGSIQQIKVNGIAIIDGITIDEKGIKKYQEEYVSALLFPFANRVKNGHYRYKEKEYQLPINEKTRGHAIHGCIADKEFLIEEIKTNQKEAYITLKYISNELIKGFPFKFSIKIYYVIQSIGHLTTKIEVQNLDTESFPFTIGWHPYFKTNDLKNSILKTSFEKRILCDDSMIPISKERYEKTEIVVKQQYFDTAFIATTPKIQLKTPSYKIEMEHDAVEKYVQLYTPDDRTRIAIEPMTGNINAFNNKEGIIELKPQEKYAWTINTKINTSYV